MSITVLSLSSYLQNMEGGSSSPFLARASDSNGMMYEVVVKIFKPGTYGLENPTFNEFLGLILASELDLEVPSPYLIKIPSEAYSILPDGLSQRIQKCNTNNDIFFGCHYYESTLLRPISYADKKIAEYDYENIYAFDALIQNPDRRVGKPNILLTDHSCYMIDHEQCFLNCVDFDRIRDNRSCWNFLNPGVRGAHIWLKVLKRMKSRQNFLTFDTFVESLRRLRLNNIDNQVNILSQHGVDVAKWGHVRGYLQQVVADIPGFILLLNNVIDAP